MRKYMTLGLALLMFGTACAQEEEQPEEQTERVLLQVNTEGMGEIAVASEGETLAFDEEYPISSSYLQTVPGTVVKVNARGQYEYVFVKWMKNGEYWTAESEAELTLDEDTELVAVFAPSTGYEGTPVEDISEAKTMADVLALPYYAAASTERFYAYVFELKGVLYRAVCNLSEETARQIFDLEFDDPEYQQKYNTIVAALPIEHIDNMMELVPAQEELDKYVGKTAGELLDEGWRLSWVYTDPEMGMGMEHGLFTYRMGYEGTYTPGDDENEAVRPLVVTSIEYDGIGDILADLMEE